MERISARILRDLALFLVGVAVVVHESFLTALDRPFVLTVGAACMGLPLMLQRDEKRARDRDTL